MTWRTIVRLSQEGRFHIFRCNFRAPAQAEAPQRERPRLSGHLPKHGVEN